jgi:beta-glucanase (GH16 family)
MNIIPFNVLSQSGCENHFPWIWVDDCGYSACWLNNFYRCESNWELVFEDNFNGSSLDLNKWKEPWLRCSLKGDKLEYSSFNNVSVSDGMCHITAKREIVTGRVLRDPNVGDFEILSDGLPNTRTMEYTSGGIYTIDAFLFDKFEAVIRCPSGAGLWPAFWAFSAFGGRWNELDIFDGFEGDFKYNCGSIHDEDGNGCYAHQGEGCGTEVTDVNSSLTQWHKFTCVNDIWRTTWLLDDVPVLIHNRFKSLSGAFINCNDDIGIGQYLNRKSLPIEPMNVILNLQIGSATGASGPPDSNTPFPSTMDIDYIKIWSRPKSVQEVDVVEITPNPNNGLFSISFNIDSSFEKKILLFDILGKEVLSRNKIYENKIELNLSLFIKGTYLLKCIYSDKIINKKIVII